MSLWTIKKKYWKEIVFLNVHEFCVIGFSTRFFFFVWKRKCQIIFGDEKGKPNGFTLNEPNVGNSVIAAANESVESVSVLVQYENIKELIHSLRMTSVYQKLWIIIAAYFPSFSFSISFSLRVFPWIVSLREKKLWLLSSLATTTKNEVYQWVMGKH